MLMFYYRSEHFQMPGSGATHVSMRPTGRLRNSPERCIYLIFRSVTAWQHINTCE
jgi:hypothetical protein